MRQKVDLLFIALCELQTSFFLIGQIGWESLNHYFLWMDDFRETISFFIEERLYIFDFLIFQVILSFSLILNLFELIFMEKLKSFLILLVSDNLIFKFFIPISFTLLELSVKIVVVLFSFLCFLFTLLFNLFQLLTNMAIFYV